MDEFVEHARRISRRQLLTRTSLGIGAVALSSLINPKLFAAALTGATTNPAGPFKAPHFAPTAKRVIYLFQSGGPSHLELFDYKPKLEALYGQDLPPSVRMGQRLTGFTSGQAKLPVIPSKFPFKQAGKSGTWVSDLMPHTAKIVDDLCLIRSMHTEAINHDPAITLMQTGHQQPGRPSMGSWIDYGLGSENSDLPAFVVLISKGKPRPRRKGCWRDCGAAGFYRRGTKA